jgi:hypothetical protein
VVEQGRSTGEALNAEQLLRIQRAVIAPELSVSLVRHAAALDVEHGTNSRVAGAARHRRAERRLHDCASVGLVWLAAGCLALLMVSAIIFHAARPEWLDIVGNAVLGAVAACVFIGRLVLAPFGG